MVRTSVILLILAWSASMGGGCGTEEDAEEDPYATARERMVREQLRSYDRDIRDQRVLDAMRTVPRHELVPEELRAMAYDDRPLPIGYGQTISQPYIVAFMTEQLRPQPTDRVLEIGTGSGYQAAVLSHLVAEVNTIEIVAPLAERATRDLQRLGCVNVQVRAGDGYLGWPEAAPFDSIIVTCAPEDVPRPLVEQLKEGGCMIIPVGPSGGAQTLVRLQKIKGKLKRTDVLAVRFVPMTGQAAPTE
ncbi:MAG: protein-L-isoaspartate(D-aspartate) O-methyltransferase [Opitutaceae bacterium]|nr:protein-L-isoaspartate(D-aspartate) O-methyltransferase [Opitutaceae bacterium]